MHSKEAREAVQSLRELSGQAFRDVQTAAERVRDIQDKIDALQVRDSEPDRRRDVVFYITFSGLGDGRYEVLESWTEGKGCSVMMHRVVCEVQLREDADRVAKALTLLHQAEEALRS